MYVCMYVVPYLTSMMCRDGDTFLACSRRLQVDLSHPPSFMFSFQFSPFDAVVIANWLYCDNILLTAVPVFCFLVQIALLTETQAAS